MTGQAYASEASEDPEYLTVHEVAAILRVTPRRVRRLCLDGTLRATRLRQLWIVNRRNFNAYLPKRRHHHG